MFWQNMIVVVIMAFCGANPSSAVSAEQGACKARVRVEKLEIVENKMMRPQRPNVAHIRVLESDCSFLSSQQVYRATNIATQNVAADLVKVGVEWPTFVRRESFAVRGETTNMAYFRYVNQKVDGDLRDKFVELGVALR